MPPGKGNQENREFCEGDCSYPGSPPKLQGCVSATYDRGKTHLRQGEMVGQPGREYGQQQREDTALELERLFFLLPNTQRQHRTSHIQEDVLSYALC